MSITEASPVRSVIDATVAAVTDDPAAAKAVFQVDHQLVGTTKVAVKAGSGHRFFVDEPAAFAGGNEAPNPVEYALAALGSCQAVTYRFWAERLDIQFDSLEISIEGDLDVRGFFGLDGAERPGFEAVRVVTTISGPDSEQDYLRLAATVEDHCPVLDLFRNPSPVEHRVIVSS